MHACFGAVAIAEVGDAPNALDGQIGEEAWVCAKALLEMPFEVEDRVDGDDGAEVGLVGRTQKRGCRSGTFTDDGGVSMPLVVVEHAQDPVRLSQVVGLPGRLPGDFSVAFAMRTLIVDEHIEAHGQQHREHRFGAVVIFAKVMDVEDQASVGAPRLVEPTLKRCFVFAAEQDGNLAARCDPAGPAGLFGPFDFAVHENRAAQIIRDDRGNQEHRAKYQRNRPQDVDLLAGQRPFFFWGRVLRRGFERRWRRRFVPQRFFQV